MTIPLTVEEARSLEIPPGVRKLLTPEEIARLAAVPLEENAADHSVTLAADAAAPADLEMVLRMRLGVRRVEVRPAPRPALEILIESHFQPYWSEKGWRFPGLPAVAADAEEPVPPEERPPARAASPAPGAKPIAAAGTKEHPIVLFVETAEVTRKALGEIFLDSGFEPRFVTSLAEVDRDVRRDPPDCVVAHRDGPVPIDDLVPIVRRSSRPIDLRVITGYAEAIVSGAGDDRIPAFLYDLVLFFAGVVAAAGGTAAHRTEARSRAAERAARTMGLGPRDVEAARLGVLFDDLESHLRKLGGGKETEEEGSSGLRARIGQLLDPVRTPYPILEALEGRRERFDGSGPGRLAGEAISPAARILAAVDRFFALKDGEAGDELEGLLRAEAGKALDPRAVEAVLRAERAERLVDRLDAKEELVLVVDPDPIAASLLEMRLANAGFAVEVHRDGPTALAAAMARPPDLILAEVAVPGLDGFALLHRLRKAEATREVPFIFVSERNDRASTLRGLDLGADDFIRKPADLELLAAKAKGIVRKARVRRPAPAAGISGTLDEMGIVDLLQVLAASKRTVRVRVEDERGNVGEVALEKGRPVHVVLGELTGEEAFFVLCDWPKGRFTVRTEGPPADRNIHESLETLLLEACRRCDEASRLA